jgi:hypothetical protein
LWEHEFSDLPMLAEEQGTSVKVSLMIIESVAKKLADDMHRNVC